MPIFLLHLLSEILSVRTFSHQLFDYFEIQSVLKGYNKCVLFDDLLFSVVITNLTPNSVSCLNHFQYGHSHQMLYHFHLPKLGSPRVFCPHGEASDWLSSISGTQQSSWDLPSPSIWEFLWLPGVWTLLLSGCHVLLFLFWWSISSNISWERVYSNSKFLVVNTFLSELWIYCSICLPALHVLRVSIHFYSWFFVCELSSLESCSISKQFQNNGEQRCEISKSYALCVWILSVELDRGLKSFSSRNFCWIISLVISSCEFSLWNS